MDAYTAVHSQEAKEELNSQRDLISEMNTARLKDDDLRNIAEEVLEVVLEEVSVSEAEDIISNMVPESSIVGRQEKVQRILEAFGETFSRIKLKNKEQALEEFVKYRQQKRLSETWSTRHNQDKRVQRLHSTVVAEDSAIIKNGLLKMFNEKKSDPCWDSHKQVGMKQKGGKMVPNCVPKNEEVEVDEAMSSYDKNRKRAAQRAADRNAARAAGKTGVVPGVGYVTPRREKETYTDEKGTVRHKSGAKNEEVETEVEEGYKELSRGKRNTMFRKAGNCCHVQHYKVVTKELRQVKSLVRLSRH